MPSLFRLLVVLSTLAGVVFGGLYVLATRFEPEPQVISKPVTGVKVKRDAPPPAPATDSAEPQMPAAPTEP